MGRDLSRDGAVRINAVMSVVSSGIVTIPPGAGIVFGNERGAQVRAAGGLVTRARSRYGFTEVAPL